MIGHLRGTLVEKHPPRLLVEVGGVGYEVEAPLSVFYELPANGEPVFLLTHLMVKEDAHNLYGFLKPADRELFRGLLKVSGVGAKLALAILSGLSTDEFAMLIRSGDVAALVRVPGIGKKTAERLIVEMRDRLSESAGGDSGLPGSGFGGPRDPASEAALALGSLGYKPAEVSRMVRNVARPEMSAEEIIRLALKAQGKK